MLHVYGVIDNTEIRGAVPRGHGGAELVAFSAAGLAAVVSEADGAVFDSSVAHVWHHEQVLSALMEWNAVLPMRFGVVCAANQLSAMLEERRDALRAALRRLAGKVEVAVRVSPVSEPRQGAEAEDPDGFPADSSGTAYLLARARRRQTPRANEAVGREAGDVRKHLERLSIETAWHIPESAGQPFKASCLVARQDLAGFVAAVDRLAAVQANVLVSCTGPWAPYSFVDRPSAEGRRA